MPDTTLDYGKTAWALKLGTVPPTTNTSADADWGSGGAAGNYIALFCPPDTINFGADFQDKVRANAAGYNFVTRAGKRQFVFEGTGLIVEGEEAGHDANVVTTINKVTTWITTRQEAADTIFYLILRINSKSVVFYQNTTAKYYCGVHCDRFRYAGLWRGHAKFHFSFKEAWSP